MNSEDDLRAEIDLSIKEFTKEIKGGLQPNDYWTAQAALLAAKIARLNDMATLRLVVLTKQLMLLTVALLFLTAYLAQRAYSEEKAADQAQLAQPKQR